MRWRRRKKSHRCAVNPLFGKIGRIQALGYVLHVEFVDQHPLWILSWKKLLSILPATGQGNTDHLGPVRPIVSKKRFSEHMHNCNTKYTPIIFLWSDSFIPFLLVKVIWISYLHQRTLSSINRPNCKGADDKIEILSSSGVQVLQDSIWQLYRGNEHLG